MQSGVLRGGSGGWRVSPNETYSGTFCLQTSFPSPDGKCRFNISTLTDSLGRKRSPDAKRNRKKNVAEKGTGRRRRWEKHAIVHQTIKKNNPED